MYPIDDSKTCSIYNSSFLHDLKNYSIVDRLNDSRSRPSSSSDNEQTNTPTNNCIISYKDSYQKTTKEITCGDGGADGLGDRSCTDEDGKSVNSSGELLDPEGNRINDFSSVNIRIDSLKSILNTQTFSVDNCWLPVFIKNNDHIISKEIISGNVIGTRLLGIEKFVSIDSPRFNNWEILNDDNTPSVSGVSLASDWIINSNLSYLEIEYGVLFWHKKNTLDNSDIKQYKLSELPPNTRLVPVNDYVNTEGETILRKTDTLIKVDNKSVKFLDKSPKDFAFNPPKFTFGSDAIDLSTQNFGTTNYSDLTFYAYYNKNFVGESDNFVIPNGKLWISDGESYSYFLNTREREDYWTHRTTKMPSKSYLSPGLYHIYRAIYNALSIKRTRNISSIGTVVYQEKLKKLCSVLSTGPYIDRVSINSLYDPDIQNSINSYLTSAASNNADAEIQELLSIISTIYNFLSPLSSKIENQTNSINYIRTPADLCKKMLMKYGASLRIEKEEIKKIKFKPPLDNGPHAYFDINLKTFCDKNLTPSTSDVPKYIYNKFSYNIGDVVIKNSLDIDSNNRLKSQSLRILSSNDNTTNRIDIPWDITIDSKP